MAASIRDSQQDDTEKVLFVGDLGYNVTDQILDKAFAQFGTVTRAYISRNSRGESLGYGFVRYEAATMATQVVQVAAEQGYFYIGGSPRPVIVEHAETKAQRARRPPVSAAILGEDPLAACSAPPPSNHLRDFADNGYDESSSSNARKFEFVEPDPDTLEGKYMLKLAEHLKQHQREVARLKQDHLEEQRNLEDQQFAKVQQGFTNAKHIEDIGQILSKIDSKYGIFASQAGGRGYGDEKHARQLANL
mmetsp:Transcript_30027/g.50493  ORF Transcript_30027/g.50493 Transcript_30027/m.50493 type:complete len:248 (-) Transcript_30027:115-858(-)|eukprot:CAMPEP_0198208002 /NCGR_PEP_ID=MMETSP1445-20131203/11409_1 /TAXON_ID=36898 /ORGANISM="Pyramimonas sp., Strain CCMP2087" /LENGTH=247 /DNA_ID=CAMNT_0043881235 /DNA_START=183 /DNA_END=926 /DNA_ORIENTATION=-